MLPWSKRIRKERGQGSGVKASFIKKEISPYQAKQYRRQIECDVLSVVAGYYLRTGKTGMRKVINIGRTVVTCYRDLRVWRLGVDLAEEIYRLTAVFPRQESYGLSTQLRKSAVSIPSNISEGHTRESRREFLHFLSIAQGSLSELETQLEIAARLSYISPSDLAKIRASTSGLGKQLYALRNALRRRSGAADSRPLTPGP